MDYRVVLHVTSDLSPISLINEILDVFDQTEDKAFSVTEAAEQYADPLDAYEYYVDVDGTLRDEDGNIVGIDY